MYDLQISMVFYILAAVNPNGNTEVLAWDNEIPWIFLCLLAFLTCSQKLFKKKSFIVQVLT